MLAVPLSPICYLLSAFARLGLLRHVGRICRRADQANNALRDRRFPRIPLPGGQIDAVQRGGGGSHIHKGRSGGDLNEQVGAGGAGGKDGDGAVGRGDGARAVNKSDPWKLWCKRGQRADGDGVAYGDRAGDGWQRADGDGVGNGNRLNTIRRDINRYFAIAIRPFID